MCAPTFMFIIHATQEERRTKINYFVVIFHQQYEFVITKVIKKI